MEESQGKEEIARAVRTVCESLGVDECTLSAVITELYGRRDGVGTTLGLVDRMVDLVRGIEAGGDFPIPSGGLVVATFATVYNTTRATACDVLRMAVDLRRVRLVSISDGCFFVETVKGEK